ncbi:MAG: PfkB family carbohydrate kinase [Ardenticatenaceae bacterium]|nr:PfkB family carbohydrate kinase [Ardenticatenaceae bacterium]
MRYASWGIIIDDIVFPDGRTAMGQLGGGGLYAALGMRVWSPDVGIVAAVGADFEREPIERLGLDSSGVFTTALPTPRAWQLFEEDGTRTQIPRVLLEAWCAQLVLSPTPQTIPATVQAAHSLGRGDPEEGELVAALAAAGVRLSAEPVIDSSITGEERALLLQMMAHYEFFSPGHKEAELLVGPRSALDLLRALADYGPRIVALRQGAAGSLVYGREQDRFWQVPPAEARVVDVTGAGNAYCGGFLVGLVEQGEIPPAAACAAVSAALMLEQVGPPSITPEVEAEAWRRHARALAGIRLLERG